MQTRIHAALADQPGISEADQILRTCVHCGFCTAVCPTYQLLGDELDGPRGRIYLIKNMLEDNDLSGEAALHLDRCLTCRACEPACPSGVEYGRLLEIGRELRQQFVKPPVMQRLKSLALRTVVPRRWLFGPLLRTGQVLRGMLPELLRRYVPQRSKALVDAPNNVPESRAVIVLGGCVQRAATPNVNTALTNLLAKQGVGVRTIKSEGCCGALDLHLAAGGQARARMRDLIDRLLAEPGDLPILSTASGCGVTIKEYPAQFKHDNVYGPRAQAVASRVLDASEFLQQFEFTCEPARVAFHSPCSLQHGQGLGGMVEGILAKAGFELVTVRDPHLCCGSAGTYSMMQPEIATRLRENKRTSLLAQSPDIIATANVGCQLYLQEDNGVPVVHWLELLWDRVVNSPQQATKTQ